MLVDVDGVVSLFGFGHTAPPRGFPVLADGNPYVWAGPSGTPPATTDAQVSDLETWASELRR